MTPLSLCLSLSLVLSATIASAGLGTPSDVPVPIQTPEQSEDQFPSFSPNSPQSADLLSTSPSVSASEVSQASGILRSSPLIPLESHLEPTLSAESPAQATRDIADDPEALAAFHSRQEHHRKLSDRSKPGKSVMPAVTPDYILQQLKRLYLLASLNGSVDSGYSTYEAATQRVDVVKRPISAAQMIKELQLPDSWEELLASAQRAGNASVQTPTPLTRVENTYSYPWSATVQLFATYPNQLGLCSGALIAKHHVLTAGHCVYSHDDKEWATHIEVDASSTDVLYPLHNSFDDTTAFYNRHLLDRPNGAAYATYMRTYNGWINNGDLAYDMAVITIDRDMGSLAGGFGMASGGVFPGSLLTWGYPASDDYLGVWQYNRGADAVESTLPNGFNDAELDAEIHHGDSGGPMWFYQKSPALYEIRAVTSYTLAGVHTPAFGNIIVPSRMSDIQGWISSDPAPAAKSQIIQFVNVPTAAVFPGTVAVTAPAGGNVGIQFFLANRAFVDCTQVIAIRYAFSTTTLLSGASKDTVSVTVTTVSALAANHYVAIPSTSGLVEVAIPGTLPSGLFYVLAYWDATCAVYDSNYSFAVLGAVTVQGKSA